MEFIQPLIEQFVPVIGGILVMFLVEKAKAVQAIPVSGGQVARLRFLASGLSTGLMFLNAYLNGNLGDEGLYQPLVKSAEAWLIAHLAYRGYLNQPK